MSLLTSKFRTFRNGRVALKEVAARVDRFPRQTIIGGISIVLTACWSAFADSPAPAVSPDPLADVPLASANDLAVFHNYSWRSFIALNWPAEIGPAYRGLPDRRRAFGDPNGPRVWMTWKSRYEIFQPGGKVPSPWTSYEGQNPCGRRFSNDELTLSSFSKFSDFNQRFGNPLVAQNRTYVRYEVRVNEIEFDSIVGNKWYIYSNLPPLSKPVAFNIGSTEIKAAWRLLRKTDEPVRSRYYVARDAWVFNGKECTKHDVALVGFHIVTKTRERPQWIWSTFEHIDNVPAVTTEPNPPPNVPFSFNNIKNPQRLYPEKRPTPISSVDDIEVNPSPMQVVRLQPIREQVMEMNRAYWNLPEIKGTIWQNYMLVMTQFPTKVAPEDPTNDGDPFPNGGSALSNTTMETYEQSMSCMACHLAANQSGRDFVFFVAFDAFKPGVPTPADLFSAKVYNGQFNAGNALSSDPMLTALMRFFDATANK